ncbi:MAG: hypothetical protein JW896_11770 [Deltaproteobacteria bacterium]|nr:hypothetical protein [Deltaproteobacteria bacterium]
MIDQVSDGDRIIAIIIRNSHSDNGITFFTPADFSQQLAYMKRPAGYEISPHIHKKVDRNVRLTQEVLFVKKGRVKVNLYTNERKFLQSAILTGGDVVLLASGGHGFEILDDTEMFEVKQGPYLGEGDKERFEPKE